MVALENIMGLKEVAVLLSPLILALILGGSNVYKVLFLMTLFYIIFIVLVIVNAFHIHGFDMDAIFHDKKSNITCTQKIIGFAFRDKRDRFHIDSLEEVNIKTSSDLDINFSGKDWENVWSQVLMDNDHLSPKGLKLKRRQQQNLKKDDKGGKEEEEEEKSSPPPPKSPAAATAEEKK